MEKENKKTKKKNGSKEDPRKANLYLYTLGPQWPESQWRQSFVWISFFFFSSFPGSGGNLDLDG